MNACAGPSQCHLTRHSSSPLRTVSEQGVPGLRNTPFSQVSQKLRTWPPVVALCLGRCFFSWRDLEGEGGFSGRVLHPGPFCLATPLAPRPSPSLHVCRACLSPSLILNDSLMESVQKHIRYLQLYLQERLRRWESSARHAEHKATCKGEGESGCPGNPSHRRAFPRGNSLNRLQVLYN